MTNKKQNTDIEEVVEELDKQLEYLFNDAVKQIIKQIKGKISEGERKDYLNKLEQDGINNIRQTLTAHGQKMYEQGFEQGKNKAVDWIRGSSIWQLVPNTPRKIMCSDKELDIY